MSDDRLPVYEEDGKVVYRASALGHCTKMLAAIRMGYEPSPTPEGMQKTFDKGTAAEDQAIKLLKRRDWTITNRQQEFDLALTGRLIVRCHIDGKNASGTPIEIKSQSAAEFKNPRDALWDAYGWQFAVIMLAANRPKLVVVRFNRDEPESNQSIAIEFIEAPPHSRSEILKRVLEIERIAHSGVLPETCVMEYPCPVYKLHPAVVDEVPTIESEAADELAQSYVRARRFEKKWKGVKDEARRGLRMAIVEQDVRTRSGFRVRFRDQPRSSISEKLMKDKGWDPEEVKETTYTEYIDVDPPEGYEDVTPTDTPA